MILRARQLVSLRDEQGDPAGRRRPGADASCGRVGLIEHTKHDGRAVAVQLCSDTAAPLCLVSTKCKHGALRDTHEARHLRSAWSRRRCSLRSCAVPPCRRSPAITAVRRPARFRSCSTTTPSTPNRTSSGRTACWQRSFGTDRSTCRCAACSKRWARPSPPRRTGRRSRPSSRARASRSRSASARSSSTATRARSTSRRSCTTGSCWFRCA